jgi:hypothetical protein
VPEGKTRCPDCGKKNIVDDGATAEKPAAEKSAKKTGKHDEPKKEAAAEAKAEPAPAKAAKSGEEVDHCARCARLRSALRDARRRVRTLTQENRTLREELLSAGEMIENLASDIERPILEPD